MNKEEFLKAIMELPKVETINPIITMNGINIDDLMSAVDRLNKVPDYNDLLKENKKLQEELKYTIGIVEHNRIIGKKNKEIHQLKDNWDKLKKWLYEEHYLYVSEIAKNSTYQVVLNKMQELERGSDSNVKD